MSAPRHMVAIVDDDPKVLEALQDLLESKGIGVCAFRSAHDLLTDTRFATIDCLITDIAMPDMNGVELSRETARKRPKLPVFYISGDLEMAALAESNCDNRGRVFKKPFDSKALVAAVQAAI